MPAGYYLEMLHVQAAAGEAGPAVQAVIDVRMFTVGPVQENCFIVRGQGSDTAVIVDPGDEAERLIEALERARDHARSTAILITHTHFDHVGAVAPLARATGAPVYCPELEREVLADIMAYVPWPGFGPFESYEADHTVAGGETLELAGLTIDVRFTPGHSPGHVTYAIRGEDGAVLRRRPVPGLGRPRRSARRRLADAAGVDRVADRTSSRDETTVYPGPHGHHDARRERATNPFLRELARQ